MDFYAHLSRGQKMFLRTMWLAGKLGLGNAITRLMLRVNTKRRPGVERDAFGDYRPGRHDVLVCTYEKSGTNWMMQIVHQIATRGAGEFEHIHEVVPWPDAAMPVVPTSLEDPIHERAPTGMRAIKTHSVAPFVPFTPEARYVVVVRDPKEVFVSMYHFVHSVIRSLAPINIPIDEFMDKFLRDETGMGSWVEHTASWWPLRHEPNVLILSFVELINDLEAGVRRVAALMGVELTPEELATVVERSHFTYMRANRDRFTPPAPRLRSNHEPILIRSGRAGNTGELIDDAQRHAIDQYALQGLQRLGSDFPYPDGFGPDLKTLLAAQRDG